MINKLPEKTKINNTFIPLTSIVYVDKPCQSVDVPAKERCDNYSNINYVHIILYSSAVLKNLCSNRCLSASYVLICLILLICQTVCDACFKKNTHESYLVTQHSENNKNRLSFKCGPQARSQ